MAKEPCLIVMVDEMRLRDYFAAQAMNGWAAGRNNGMDFFRVDGSGTDMNYVAESSYRLADAMMKAREK